jgi:hypothetical protein
MVTGRAVPVALKRYASGRFKIITIPPDMQKEIAAGSETSICNGCERDIANMPLVRERFASVGVTVAASERRSPEYLARFVPRELDKWAGPIQASGVSAD